MGSRCGRKALLQPSSTKAGERLLALPSLPLPHPRLPQPTQGSPSSLLSCSPVKFGPCLLHGGDRPTGCHSNFCGLSAPRPLPVGHWGIKSHHGHIFCPRRCLVSRPCHSAVQGRCCTLAACAKLLHGFSKDGFFGKGAAGFRMLCITSLSGDGVSGIQVGVRNPRVPSSPCRCRDGGEQ